MITKSPADQAAAFTSEQTTDVELSVAGIYTFLGTITDGVTGESVPSDVTVTVAQTASSIQMSFGSPHIMPGTQVQFGATELDQFGNAMTSQKV